MKKIFSVLLTLVLVLSLAGCSVGKEDPITYNWRWKTFTTSKGSMENVAKTNSELQFSSDGKTATFTSTPDKVYNCTVKKLGDGNYELTNQFDVVMSVVISGDTLTLSAGTATVVYERVE